MEPRRQPAGRARAEGALRRHGVLRQQALDARRQAEHRLGQDGAVPHHRSVQPGRPRARDASRSRRSAHPALVDPRRVLVLLGRVRSKTCASSSPPISTTSSPPTSAAAASRSRCSRPATRRRASSSTASRGSASRAKHRPPNPWDDASGFEYGARLEFRLGRFSFQLSDFFGYEDLPYAERLFDYSRNVDPISGRPRQAGATGRCTTGQESACLGLSPASGITPDGTALNLSDENRQAVLNDTPVNMQLFAMICSTSIGFNSIDPTACGQTVFNSLSEPADRREVRRATRRRIPARFPVSATLSNALAGNATAANSILLALTRVPIPFVRLNADPCDALSERRLSGQGAGAGLRFRSPSHLRGDADAQRGPHRRAGGAARLRRVLRQRLRSRRRRLREHRGERVHAIARRVGRRDPGAGLEHV